VPFGYGVGRMPLAGALDTLLDRTIVLGYGDVRLHARRRLPGWPEDPPRMDATHVLAPFALTSWLSDLLVDGAPTREINVTSGGMYAQGLPARDWQSEHTGYSPPRIYARTRREEVMITELWAERLRDRGVVVHATHPGWVDTAGVRDALPGFRSLTRPGTKIAYRLRLHGILR
jgi:NAD(P)-dependent dehydrogenase (short-subunit alcohol dehydrogenase family)